MWTRVSSEIPLKTTGTEKEIFMWYANMPTKAKGPVKVDSRYISEDIPQGLVMLETLGEKAECRYTGMYISYRDGLSGFGT